MYDVSLHDQLLRAVAATCVESMALQFAPAMEWSANVQTAVANVAVVCTEQPGSGDSVVVSLLVIELTWLGIVYDGQ